MTIENNKSKDQIIINLEEKEFTLLAYLLEKSSQETIKKGVIKDPIDVQMNETFKRFLTE